jgi:hypothetical protein
VSLQPVVRRRGVVPRIPVLIGATIALSSCGSSAPATSSATASALASATATSTIASTPTAEPTPTVVDGTWEVTITEADILAAGIVDAEEDNPGNYDNFTLSLQAGAWELNQLDGEHNHDSGTYVIQGTIWLGKNAAGEGPSAYPFTLSTTTLTFKPFLTANGAVDFTRSGPVTLRTKPWTHVGP